MNNFGEKVGFIWSVADLLRGPYRPNQYKDVMLPLTVLRRLDCVLEPTNEKVLQRQEKLAGGKVKNIEPILCRVTGVPFYNTSRFTFEKLKGDPNNIAANLTNYIKGFPTRAREIIERFGFEEHIAKLDKADRLFLIVSRFCQIDLHPDRVSNIEMGYIFEELIRRCNEASNEEAGDHFTPREVIRLMVNLLVMPDSDVLTTKGNFEPDPELRDYENVPLKEDIDAYMQREVLPHVPDAWVDHSKTKIGYEINFNRYFYKYTPPRPLDEIEADLKQIEGEIAEMLAEVTE